MQLKLKSNCNYNHTSIMTNMRYNYNPQFMTHLGRQGDAPALLGRPLCSAKNIIFICFKNIIYCNIW